MKVAAELVYGAPSRSTPGQERSAMASVRSGRPVLSHNLYIRHHVLHNPVVFSGSLLGGLGQLTAWFDWGIDAKIEFVVVTIALAMLLLAKEIVTTSKIGGKYLSHALTIAIIPLLVLFAINLAVVFLP